MWSFLFYLNMGLYIFTCLFLILLVLIQKGRGGGLSGAFGGTGGSAAFGAKTGDVLTWTTAGFFVVFLFLTVALNLLAEKHQHSIAPSTPVITNSPNAPR